MMFSVNVFENKEQEAVRKIRETFLIHRCFAKYKAIAIILYIITLVSACIIIHVTVNMS